MKTVKWIALPMMAIALTSIFTACGGEDEVTPNTQTTGGGTSGETVKEKESASSLTSEEQKERLTKIGQAFFEAIPESDFRELADLGTYINKTYCNRSSKTEDIEDWADACFKSLAKEVLPEQITDQYSYSYYDTWNERYSYYESVNMVNYTRRTYELSNFRAHLSWNGSKWVVAESNTNDFQATCMDKNGKVVTITLTSSNQTKKVYVGEFKRGSDYDYNYYYDVQGNYHSVSTYTKEKDKAYLEVPDWINVTLTRGGETLVMVEVKTDLSSMSSPNFDLSKDAFSATVTAELAGYKIETARVAVQTNKSNGVTAYVNILKNGNKLLSVEVQGDANINESDLVWKEDVDEDDFEDAFEDAEGKVSLAKIDILGQMQVTATCSDIRNIVNNLDAAGKSANKYDESKIKYYAQEINKTANIKFYYDGNNTLQGSLEMECVAHTGSSTKYNVEPVVVFGDGSRYNLINETYFSETNFRSLINLFKNLKGRYEDMIEEYD